jgi:hypothetical protein
VTQLLFPDNTVLVNFALINRMDLLEKLVNGRGRWCATVAFECARSAQEPGLDAMNLADEIFGSPWYPQSGAERQDIEIMRLELASPGDTPYKHLGEADAGDHDPAVRDRLFRHRRRRCESLGPTAPSTGDLNVGPDADGWQMQLRRPGHPVGICSDTPLEKAWYP